MKLNWFRLSFVVLLLLTACNNESYHIALHKPEQEGVLSGQYIPYFELPDSTGTIMPVDIGMGKATIIDFWASWCRPCRESANPAYKKLYYKYHKRGLNIIGISTDRHMYFWKKALKQDSLQWLQLIDSSRQILKKYKVKSLPTMYLINQRGQIIGKNLWGEKLADNIEKILEKP